MCFPYRFEGRKHCECHSKLLHSGLVPDFPLNLLKFHRCMRIAPKLSRQNECSPDGPSPPPCTLDTRSEPHTTSTQSGLCRPLPVNSTTSQLLLTPRHRVCHPHHFLPNFTLQIVLTTHCYLLVTRNLPRHDPFARASPRQPPVTSERFVSRRKLGLLHVCCSTRQENTSERFVPTLHLCNLN